MKGKTIVAVTAIVVMATLVMSHTASAKKGGTSILHWMLKATMTNSGVEPGASGSVAAKQNQQGNANNQRLALSLAGLTSNTTYSLQAQLGNDTNHVAVADLTTDDNGAARVKYVKKN